MFTQTRWRQTFLAPILMLVLISGLFITTPQAHAQVNRDAMMAQIQQLLTLITSLQQQLLQMTGGAPVVGTPSSDVSLKIGAKIQTSRQVNARSGPGVSASWVNTIGAFSRGQIVDGPRSADGFTWWLVKYESGTQGWSIGSALWGIETPKNAGYPADEEDSEDLSIEIVSPRGGTYTYGDTLTVKWEQTGSVPKGSIACATLFDSSAGGGFVFPGKGGCVDVAGEEPIRSISGKIERTSGYNLAPGKYKIQIVILGPDPLTGKDRSTLTEHSRTITISEEEEAVSIDADIASVSLGVSPTIKGTANGTGQVGISITYGFGDKVYGSGQIKVTDGKWSHTVTDDLDEGIYTAYLYLDNKEVDREIFLVQNQDDNQDKIDDLLNQVSQLQKVYAVGVYEASNANHSFCESGWGDVTVTVSPDLAGSFVTLVLSSYEPVRWNIKNPAGVDINRIILSGYNAQDVTGAIGRADIEHRTFYHEDRYTEGAQGQGAFYDKTAGWPSKIYHWASQCPTSNAIPVENRRNLTGGSDYAYAYTSSDNRELLSKVKSWTGLDVTSFQGAYSGSNFTVSKTQVLGVSTASQDAQLRDILVSLTDLLKQVK